MKNKKAKTSPPYPPQLNSGLPFPIVLSWGKTYERLKKKGWKAPSPPKKNQVPPPRFLGIKLFFFWSFFKKMGG